MHLLYITRGSAMEDAANSDPPDRRHYHDTVWLPQHERILSDWGDKAMCYKWLHSKTNAKYYRQNAMYTIPVIIISTITGTANFAQDRFDESIKPYAAMVIGGFNILAGIVTTVQQFLKVSELNEAHRVSSIAWDKFYRNIRTELSQQPCERIPAGQMLKTQKEEFDRLIETSPRIPDSIIHVFKKTFPSTDPVISRISLPEICDKLQSTNDFRYVEEIEIRFEDDVAVAAEADAAEIELATMNRIGAFGRQFLQTKLRNPYEDELVHNLKNVMQLSDADMRDAVRRYARRRVTTTVGSGSGSGGGGDGAGDAAAGDEEAGGGGDGAGADDAAAGDEEAGGGGGGGGASGAD